MDTKKLLNREFKECQIVSFKINPDQDATLRVRKDDSTIAEIIFIETIQFNFKSSVCLSKIYEVVNFTDFMAEALSREYAKQPYPLDEYQEYHLQNSDGSSFLKIVCKKLKFLDGYHDNNKD